MARYLVQCLCLGSVIYGPSGLPRIGPSQLPKWNQGPSGLPWWNHGPSGVPWWNHGPSGVPWWNHGPSGCNLLIKQTACRSYDQKIVSFDICVMWTAKKKCQVTTPVKKC